MATRLELEMVEEFVTAAHGDLERVEDLLALRPSLVNATWDWGGGDWETALGGASHMGRRDIAEFLLGRGARMDLFAAAMLGHLELIRAAVAADPAIVDVPGPHGISLAEHARAGGQGAVVAFIEGTRTN